MDEMLACKAHKRASLGIRSANPPNRDLCHLRFVVRTRRLVAHLIVVVVVGAALVVLVILGVLHLILVLLGLGGVVDDLAACAAATLDDVL